MRKPIAASVAELVGNTPLLELANYEKNHALKARLVAKVEFFNPGGSAKDRVGLALIDDGASSSRGAPSWSRPAGTPVWGLPWLPRRAGIM